MSHELYDAATFGDHETVMRLIKINPKIVNWCDKYKFTALHGAAGEEDTEMVKLLVSQGADINAQNDMGITPLHMCAYPQMARLLISLGANIELRSSDGNTPLLELCTEPEREDVIQVLLESGANVNVKNLRSETPLEIAKSREEMSKELLLKRYGAK
jgi:ankyrin repeat protein